MANVINTYGVEIDYDFAVYMMDDETREALAFEMAPCDIQDFFNAYAAVHAEKFGEEWELAKKNPIW